MLSCPVRRPSLPGCPDHLRRQENAVKVLAVVFVIAVVFMAAVFVAAWMLKESKDQTEEEAERMAKGADEESAGVTVEDLSSSVHKALIKPLPEILKDLSPEELGQLKEDPHTYINNEENAECTEQFVMKNEFLRNDTRKTAASNVTTEMTNRGQETEATRCPTCEKPHGFS
ncbi:uncharacterized protein LOC143927407 [Lithobates pipiens]